MYGGYHVRKIEREEEAKRERITKEGKHAASITPTLCPLPGLRRDEAITVTHLVDSFLIKLRFMLSTTGH